MARGLASAINQVMRAAERDAKRRQAQAIRDAGVEHNRQAAAIKSEYIWSREDEVESLNAELEEFYSAIDGILAATLDVDDFLDLKELYRRPIHPPIDCSKFETPTPHPQPIQAPPQPIYKKPSSLWALLGKKRYEVAVSKSLKAYDEVQAQSRSSFEAIEAIRQELVSGYEQTEQQRIADLERTKENYVEECNQREREVSEHNLMVDELIANLGYGSAEAVEAYVSLVFSKSNYPEHFPVSHEPKFDPTTAELTLRVSIPPPSEMSTIKAYRYVKKNDEIAHSQLSQKAQKDRYASAVNQIALRSIHEVFEADRRAIIKTVSIEVGTTFAAPATGIVGFLPFAAVAAEREAFLEFDLSAVVPKNTLSHLGASLSKNPFGLVATTTTGVRIA